MAAKTATLPATAVEPELREALARIAAADDVSLGHVIRRACEAYVQASAAPAKPVSPPRARKAREDTGPVVAFVAAEEPKPAPNRAHALTCKCMTCKPGGKP